MTPRDLLIACRLSGQISDAQWRQHLAEDPSLSGPEEGEGDVVAGSGGCMAENARLRSLLAEAKEAFSAGGKLTLPAAHTAAVGEIWDTTGPIPVRREWEPKQGTEKTRWRAPRPQPACCGRSSNEERWRSEMSNEITSTHELDEAEWSANGEPDDGGKGETDMVATREPEGRGIEFHVSMRDYTQRDMETLIVEAAARVIVGNYGGNAMSKLVEERCVALITAKADKHLAGVTAEIIDQPIMPKYGFMRPDQKPVTMREFIGLTGRDYLNGWVDNCGKTTTDNRYGKSRIQYLVESYMQQAFETEIKKATSAAISEIQAAIRAEHTAFLEAEKARIREAIAKVSA